MHIRNMLSLLISVSPVCFPSVTSSTGAGANIITFRRLRYKAWETIQLNDLHVQPPPLVIRLHSPHSFIAGRPGIDSEMDIEFSPLEILDEKIKKWKWRARLEIEAWGPAEGVKNRVRYDLWGNLPSMHHHTPLSPLLSGLEMAGRGQGVKDGVRNQHGTFKAVFVGKNKKEFGFFPLAQSFPSGSVIIRLGEESRQVWFRIPWRFPCLVSSSVLEVYCCFSSCFFQKRRRGCMQHWGPLSQSFDSPPVPLTVAQPVKSVIQEHASSCTFREHFPS